MEIEGERIDTGNYKLKKTRMQLASREAEIASLKSLLEEKEKAFAAKVETLEKSVAFYKKRYSATRKPREKPKSETTDGESQGVQETVGEDPVSPPISD
jgi:peptidoglycan hydrolase CwlO-like protein